MNAQVHYLVTKMVVHAVQHVQYLLSITTEIIKEIDA